MTMLRSRSYLGLLVLAAILGVPVSAVAYGFLALVSYLQEELFTHLPHGLGYQAEPVWWPVPMLAIGGALAALAIRYLPGRGGPSPAGGFKMHGPPGLALTPLVIVAVIVAYVTIVRDWWARRQQSAPRKPVSKIEIVRTGIGTEKRWPLLGALAVAIAVPLLLPARFSLGPNWIVPAVVALLLVAIVVADPVRDDRRPAVVRALSLALMVVLVAEAAGVTARLVADLVEGGPETNNATDLLSVGFGVWLYTILAFSFLYWVLDGGGPDARLWAPPEYPNLAFPEQLNPVCSPPGWRP